MTIRLPGKGTTTIITVIFSFNNNCTVSLPPSCTMCHCLCTIFILSSSAQSQSRICTGRQQYKTIYHQSTQSQSRICTERQPIQDHTNNRHESHAVTDLYWTATIQYQQSTQKPITDLHWTAAIQDNTNNQHKSHSRICIERQPVQDHTNNQHKSQSRIRTGQPLIRRSHQ